MARPTLLTDELSEKICTAARSGLTNEQIAKLVGICPATIYNWLERGRAGDAGFLEFLEAFKKAQAECELRLVQTIQRAANVQDNWQAAAWLLERKYRKRWGRWRVTLPPVEVVAELMTATAGLAAAGALPETGVQAQYRLWQRDNTSISTCQTR